MDGRPPKRQRRSVLNDPEQSKTSKQTVISSRPKPRARPGKAPSPRISSSPSPKKPGSSSSPNTKQSKSLRSFFQPATEGQRWSSHKFEPKRSLETVSEATLDADVIEDDYDSYDEIFTQHLAGVKTGEAIDTKSKDGPSQTRRPSKQSSRPKKQPTKRFLMPTESNGTRSQSPAQSVEADKRPWAQRFAPSNLDELAVHKRKVSDVQTWLEDAFSGRRREVSDISLLIGASEPFC